MHAELSAGRPPKERRIPYVIVENDIAQAKLNYGLQIGQIFCYIFPDSGAMDHFAAMSFAYLDRVSYLVVGA